MTDENAQLREQISAMQKSANQLEQEHKLQMAEALDNFQAVQEAHKKELSEMQDAANQQSKPLPLIHNLYGRPVLSHTSSDNFAIPCQFSTIPRQFSTTPRQFSTIPCQFSTIPCQFSTIPCVYINCNSYSKNNSST